MSRTDPSLVYPGLFIDGVAQKISVFNNSERLIFVRVIDDENRHLFDEFEVDVTIGPAAVAAKAKADGSKEKLVCQEQAVSPGQRSVFSIKGACGYLWVSDQKKFPAARIILSAIRVDKGMCKQVDEIKFSEQGLKILDPVDAACVDDTPKKKGKKTCSYCSFEGHYITTCELKKAMEQMKIKRQVGSAGDVNDSNLPKQ